MLSVYMEESARGAQLVDTMQYAALIQVAHGLNQLHGVARHFCYLPHETQGQATYLGARLATGADMAACAL